MSNQLISRHSRSAIRARCSITQRLLSLMERIAQTSLPGHIIHFAHHLPELGTMHHLIRLGFPFMRPEVMIPKTDRYELFRKLIGKKFMSVNDVSRPTFLK